MGTETSKEKKGRLAIRKELETILGKILIDKNLDLESFCIGSPPDNHMVIAPVSVAEIGGCHAKEIEQIEGIRKYVTTRCKMIITTMKPSRTSSAEFVTIVADLASRKIDATLSDLVQKLADCTCNCGEYVGPI